MSSSSLKDDRFHRAAKDGNLDLLAKANRKDANTRDEDGMTPTLWAAYYGNLAALRKIIERGGDADKCDYLGNTAIHCASERGHYNCVSYLINFGCNLWAMDNDHRTAMDMASVHERLDIVKLMDQARATEQHKNPKRARKLQEAAVLEADARIKDFKKRQKKTMDKIRVDDSRKAPSSTSSSSHARSIMASRSGEAILLQKNKREAKFDDGASFVSDQTYRTDSGYGDDDQDAGKARFIGGFNGLRPAFIRNRAADSLFSITAGSDRIISEEDDTNNAVSTKRARSAVDSLGSSGNYSQRNELDSVDLTDSEEENDDDDVDNLRLFLHGQGLGKYYQLFLKEKVLNMDTLMLLSDTDLEKMGLELGPRKKLLHAVLEYKSAMNLHMDITDSRL